MEVGWQAQGGLKGGMGKCKKIRIGVLEFSEIPDSEVCKGACW